MKQFFLTMVFLFVCALSVFSATISIFITQDDNVQETVRDVTYFFEDSVMNYCFENGHIITNEPISLERNTKAPIQKAYDNSIKGYSEYLITFYLDVDPVSERVLSVRSECLKLSTNKSIYRIQKKVPASKTTDLEAEKNNLISFTQSMMTDICKHITGF